MSEANSRKGRMFVPKDRTYGDLMNAHAAMVVDFGDTVLKYADTMVIPITNQICIADFCAADGYVGLQIIHRIISLIKKKWEGTDILVVFEDKAGNDCNALFRTVLNADNAMLLDGSFVMATATTMYKQCLPSNSAHFMTCFHGIHYLSKRPCVIKNSMLSWNGSPEERLLYRTQAEEDWKLFLKHRSKELVPGGLLFLITSDNYGAYGQLDVVLKTLLNDDIISKDEFSKISLNTYLRSEEELRQPFVELCDDVKDLALISLEAAENIKVKVGSGLINAEQATTITEMIRTWSYHSIVDNMATDRTKEEKKAVPEEFYKRLHERIQTMTGDYKCRVIRLVIRKKM